MADEWPQSVNHVTPKPYIIGAVRGSSGLPRRAGRCLQTPCRCTHIPRARQVRVNQGGPIMGGWILLAVVVVAVWFVVALYNRLVGARNNYKNAFAQIDVQLTRRYDLIPNLVETAKGYMKHERETLEAVIKARNSAVSGLKAAAANPGDARRDGDADRRRKRAGCDARPVVRAGRGLSGSQGQPEHDAAVRGAHVHREQGGVRAPGVQRRRDELQQPARDVSRQRHRRHVQFHARAAARSSQSPRAREAPKVSFT